MGARYLNTSELVYARWLASEMLRWRRPRRASRVRSYAPAPTSRTQILYAVLDGLRRLPEVV